MSDITDDNQRKTVSRMPVSPTSIHVETSGHRPQKGHMSDTTQDTDNPNIEPATAKPRYFRMDDGISYTVVARDLEHAKEILRATGSEFGKYGVSLDEADTNGELDWSEMPDELVRKTSVYLDEGVNRVPLCSCNLGDWFSSEW